MATATTPPTATAMSVSRASSHDRLATMADDVRQLTEPIHVAVRGRIITHLCLLDQLRAACIPGATVQGPERRHIPNSRPPLRLDPVDTLSDIYVELAGWRHRLNLPSPDRAADWQKTVMRALVGAAGSVDPGWLEWLAADVAEWWRQAAVGSGWTVDHLRRLR